MTFATGGVPLYCVTTTAGFNASQWFVGLLILGISALIAAVSSVTAAAISLTQQVHTAQYVDTMSKNVSLI